MPSTPLLGGEAAAFVENLLRKIRRLNDKQWNPRSVTIICADGDCAGIVQIPAALLAPAEPTGAECFDESLPGVPMAAPDDGFLTDKDQAIIEALRSIDKPMKSASLASYARINADSYYRDRLRRLVRIGKVKMLPDNRYCLSEDSLSG